MESFWKEFIAGLQQRSGYSPSTGINATSRCPEAYENGAGKSFDANCGLADKAVDGSPQEHSDENWIADAQDISDDDECKSLKGSDVRIDEDEDDGTPDESFEDPLEFHGD